MQDKKRCITPQKDLEVAAVVGGAEGKAREQSNQERGNGLVGGSKRARAGAAEEKAHRHVNSHVIAVEDSAIGVVGTLGQPL